MRTATMSLQPPTFLFYRFRKVPEPSMHEASAQLLSCLPSLRRYARALVGDRNGADDLVQDTLERGWRKLTTRQRDGDMRAWLFAIMHNLHVDQYRNPAIVTEEMDDDTPFPAAPGDHTQGL